MIEVGCELPLKIPNADSPEGGLEPPSGWSGSRSFHSPAIHNWYLSVMSFPDHLVDNILDRFSPPPGTLLVDPHCGSGTALIQGQKQNLVPVGVDANPASAFASRVKTTWSIDVAKIRHWISLLEESQIDCSETFKDKMDWAEPTLTYLRDSGMLDRGWIDENIAVTLVGMKNWIRDTIPDDKIRRLFTLALISSAVRDLSNTRFGPELYCVPPRTPLPDAKSALVSRIVAMADDLESTPGTDCPHVSKVSVGDSRDGRTLRAIPWTRHPCFVVTSPPYPTDHDYTRNSRLELAFLEMVTDLASLRKIKRRMLRSHSKGIYVGDRDYLLVRDLSAVKQIQQQIIERAGTRLHGFLEQYPKVIGNYFGGLLRHFQSLSHYIPNGSKLAYVVGDQASYLGVHVPTACIIVDMLQRAKLGLDVDEIVEWRQRHASTGKSPLWEHVILMTANGAKGKSG